MQIFGDKLFRNCIDKISAFNSVQLLKAFEKIEKYRKTHFLLGYIRYEVKDFFLDKNIVCEVPLLYFEVFESYENFTPNLVIENISLNPIPAISFDEYSRAFNQIKEEIANGNTYEVNLTCDFNVKYSGDDFKLFNYLLNNQNTPYCAFLKNEFESVLSFSPELFFKLDSQNHIITKPMKGTIKRGKTDEEDLELINFLKNDEKNCAENTMIVDLLRNDLGKIAKTGTVKVTKLFDVETYSTVHQMISQIEADLQNNITIFDIFKAIFPCGSITGAPKISTMQIIDKVERGKRNVYCGAIGYISPDEILFNVPIRTLQKRQGEKSYNYRVGGAVVWDSEVRDEWLECITKTSFLNKDFKIIETMKIEDGKILFEQEHFLRMKNTAKHYNYPFDLKKFIINRENNCIVRILLDKFGNFEIEYKLFAEVASNKIKLSSLTVSSEDEFLLYKTTMRPYYNVDYSDCFDEIFFNEKDELTEGSRSNIFIEKDGILFTPPVKCGLLNGIYRQNLLDNKKCTEKILYKKDLLNADKIYCTNSVRGIVEVVLA